jgi:hypothetical protein
MWFSGVTLKMQAAGYTETFVPTQLHGIIAQKPTVVNRHVCESLKYSYMVLQMFSSRCISRNRIVIFFSHGVRLSTLTAATVWPIVPALDDWWWWWWWWLWSNRWNVNWQGNPKYSEKTSSSATLSTTNPTWPDPGRRGGKPVTNRLSCGTIMSFF